MSDPWVGGMATGASNDVTVGGLYTMGLSKSEIKAIAKRANKKTIDSHEQSKAKKCLQLSDSEYRGIVQEEMNQGLRDKMQEAYLDLQGQLTSLTTVNKARSINNMSDAHVNEVKASKARLQADKPEKSSASNQSQSHDQSNQTQSDKIEVETL